MENSIKNITCSSVSKFKKNNSYFDGKYDIEFTDDKAFSDYTSVSFGCVNFKPKTGNKYNILFNEVDSLDDETLICCTNRYNPSTHEYELTTDISSSPYGTMYITTSKELIFEVDKLYKVCIEEVK